MRDTRSENRMTAPPLPAQPRHVSRDLLARWNEALGGWGAPRAVLEAWNALQDPRTRVVVTGQQPGPWGGPLFALYKAATALALVNHLTAQDGVPAVAVFWVQGEDTDWGEVGWGALPQPDLRLLRHRFEAPFPARHWVGPARLQDPAAAIALADDARVSARFRDLLPRAEPYELAPTFIRGLLSVFGDAGLLPLDGRWPELRADGRGLWARYVPLHQELARQVVARGKAHSGSGPAPLDAVAASHGLFILDGERRRPIDPTTWERDTADMLHQDPERLAPSVLLRAPLQDHLLGPVMHVVGRAERAYLDQLQPVYAALEIGEPRRLPRLSATVLPEGLVPAPARAHALADPEAWVGEAAMAHVPAEALRLVAELRKDLEERTRRLETLLGADQESREGIGAAGGKIAFELKRLEETLEKRGRRDLYREHPRLRHLAEFLRPRRAAQERGLSGGTLPLLLGDRAPAMLGEAARDHVARALAGTSDPIILEAPHV
jgi:bacillithiol synthase